ncbi:MAG: TIGR04283 family arsenosugar biosynthesis glycosyltransferase [Bacteroidota bacterium]|nr:TIGR04283 family arsenosugar biosynthesis glycosyltransferase [Bacteroidota bacterium]
MVSVIIPTLNEEAIIAKTLLSVMSQKGAFEVIVSDGGSSDNTMEIVKTFPQVKVTYSPKGRALQMNAGAEIARGEHLLFLHADTLLLPSAILKIVDSLKNNNVIGGSFFLKFDSENYALKFYSLFSKINHLLFTYGDQAFFIKNEAFRVLNGFKDMVIMEDVEIQQRLRKLGRFIKLDQAVITSGRRFLRRGVIYQQLQNIALVMLYLLGASPTLLKKHYQNEGEGNEKINERLYPAIESENHIKSH